MHLGADAFEDLIFVPFGDDDLLLHPLSGCFRFTWLLGQTMSDRLDVPPLSGEQQPGTLRSEPERLSETPPPGDVCLGHLNSIADHTCDDLSIHN